jgi:hypothetical protein
VRDMPELCGEGIIGVEERAHEFPDSPLRFLCRNSEGPYGDAAQYLTFAEGYSKGRLSLCFIFRVPQSAGGICPLNGERVGILRCVKDEDGAHGGIVRNDAAEQFIPLVTDNNGSAVPSQDEQAMLVLNVKGMGEIQGNALPASVRFEPGYRFNDLFAGGLYMSFLDGSLKSLRSGVAGEGELNFWLSISDHSEKHDVERGSDVVSGIADNERKLGRNRLLYFDVVGRPARLALVPFHKNKRLGSEKFVNSRVESLMCWRARSNLSRGAYNNSSAVGMARSIPDKDEKQLAVLARRLLAKPHKPRELVVAERKAATPAKKAAGLLPKRSRRDQRRGK